MTESTRAVRLGAQARQRRQAIAQAQRERGLAVDAFAGVQELERGLVPDDHRQGDAQAEAELGEVGAEARFGGGDPEVGGECESESAANGCTLNLISETASKSLLPDTAPGEL